MKTYTTLTSLAVLALVFAATLPQSAQAQATPLDALMQRTLADNARLTQNIMQAQQNTIQRAMQDPQIQAGYQQYLGQMQQRGGQPMDFPTYAYYYVYTNGFSNAGIALMNRNENNNRAAELERLQGVRRAELQRGQAQVQQNDRFYDNQTEAGRGLMGQSTYYGPNGYQTQLPHTWQNNTQHDYQGQTYRVTESGQYLVLGTNGWWYPINR